MDPYMIPAAPPSAPHRTELVISRSRFITSMAHTTGSAQARRFIEDVRGAFPGATHNCWAYAAGRPGDEGQAACNDDGEPAGTAGRPMLTVLIHAPVGEVTAVVTRYFGGIKLGTGGLVHAYQDAVRQALETLPLTEHMIPSHLGITVAYPHLEPVKRLLAAHRASVVRESFGADVTLEVALPSEECDPLSAAIRDLTAGRADIVRHD